MSPSWYGEPVPINTPKNDFNRRQEPAPISTRASNPFNNSIRPQRHIGNPTSKSTLVPILPVPSVRPFKRQKLDSGPPVGKNNDFPTTILDDEIELHEQNTPSLNTRPSKFSQGMEPNSSSRYFTIADDGDSFKEILPQFSSDPIEQSPPRITSDKCEGLVSRRVQKFESEGPRVDFRNMSLKSKMKNNTKKPQLSFQKTQFRNTSELHFPKLPVKSFFSDADKWESSPHQQLLMFTRDKRLFVVENQRECANEPLPSTMILAEPSEVESGSMPVIQFLCTKTITVWLDTQRSFWNKEEYIRFVNSLTKSGVSPQIIRPNQTDKLWDVAQGHAASEAHERKISAGGPEEPQGKTFDQPPFQLKRKIELDSQDDQVVSQPGSSSRKHTAFPTQRTLRSGKRASLDADPVPSAPANPDEVVLSYPAGLPGAVNITNVDLERLIPGAFLNDTLIEFGLKVWLKDLASTNPEFVHQIHLFSSFFYKKLNSKKDLQAAYESVRKWTNKCDIFEKKYIIVPINENLHWYLAIIYEPEHLLKDSPVENHESHMRPQTRLSTSLISENDSHSSITVQPKDSSEMQIEESKQRSETEVECDLESFQNSCTIEDPVLRTPSPNHSDIDEPSADVAALPVHSTSPYQHGTAAAASHRSAKGRQNPSTVDPRRFYATHGKRKFQCDTNSPGMDIDPSERDKTEITNDSRTYIFTFDSLGIRHPQAIKKLSAYLRMEAKSKKGVDARGLIEGKNALVPCQTNFCDCGIYLLHFARTFMSDPTKYANIILAPRVKPIRDLDRKAIWLVDRDFEPEGRQQLRRRIEKLSRDWKKLRNGQSEEVTNVDESEGEVELVESDKGKQSKSSRKAPPQSKRTDTQWLG